MILEEVEKLLNTLWKMSEAERLLLGNPKEVFYRFTGGHYSNMAFEGVSSFRLEDAYNDNIHIWFNPYKQRCVVNVHTLTARLIAVAEEQGICHEK